MKKSVLRSVGIIGISVLGLVGCGGAKETAEIAVVTDVGQLMDGGFNQGTYEGAKEYAEKNGKTYKYYQPANGANATDNDRIEAMEQAIKNGAKVIVAPGFLQATAMETVAEANKDVKFIFVDGWALGKDNVTAICYKEQESGFMAGYAAVKDGYSKLGATLGGGGSNPACNRYGYGYAQGINAAAKEMDKTVELKVSYKYGSSFSASSELDTQISGWYQGGTEVVFSCGGSMVQSVISAANKYDSAKIIGVDTDQYELAKGKIITSAQKGLAVSVSKVLGQYYAGQWDSVLANQAQNLGAADDATGLPTATASWGFKTFTVAEYNTLYASIKNGTVTPKSDVAENCDDAAFWSAADRGFTNVTVTLDK